MLAELGIDCLFHVLGNRGLPRSIWSPDFQDFLRLWPIWEEWWVQKSGFGSGFYDSKCCYKLCLNVARYIYIFFRTGEAKYQYFGVNVWERDVVVFVETHQIRKILKDSIFIFQRGKCIFHEFNSSKFSDVFQQIKFRLCFIILKPPCIQYRTGQLSKAYCGHCLKVPTFFSLAKLSSWLQDTGCSIYNVGSKRKYALKRVWSENVVVVKAWNGWDNDSDK